MARPYPYIASKPVDEMRHRAATLKIFRRTRIMGVREKVQVEHFDVEMYIDATRPHFVGGHAGEPDGVVSLLVSEHDLAGAVAEGKRVVDLFLDALGEGVTADTIDGEALLRAVEAVHRHGMSVGEGARQTKGQIEYFYGGPDDRGLKGRDN